MGVTLDFYHSQENFLGGMGVGENPKKYSQ